MSLVTFFIGLAVGIIFGAGMTLFYIQRKMKTQLSTFENEMEDIMDMTQEMEEAMDAEGDLQDIDIDEVEEEKED
jgi:uncharacterized protein YqgV (UPF0045/DUF77 family)